MKKFLLPFIWLYVFSIAQCKDDYEPDIVSASPKYLVVDGSIVVGENSSTKIRLSYTLNLSDTAKVIPDSTAKLTVEVEGGPNYNLAHQKSGNYIIDGLNIPAGKNVRLKIQSGNKVYASSYVPVKTTPAIDSIGFTRQRGDFQVFVNTHDAAAQARYYRWVYDGTYEYNSQYYAYNKFRIEDSSLIPVNNKEREKLYRCWQQDPSNQIFITSTDHLNIDEVYQASLKRFDFGDEKLAVGYSINVYQYTLTREAYKYFENIRKITEQLGGLFDPLPSELKGNIRNINDPKEIVIGFITASTVSTKRRYFSRPADWKYEFNCSYADTVKDFSKAGLYSYFGPYRGYPVYIDNSTLKPLAAILNYRCIDCSLRGGTNERPSFWPY
uniref:DUF4249 domain-containing protein n=1 Tax=Pedobacter schmidteae TaxID=2201271 RepID=UPI000EB1DC33|nr:DUF4249 domain-containing protein [Pedobacter schmidteae]